MKVSVEISKEYNPPYAVIYTENEKYYSRKRLYETYEQLGAGFLQISMSLGTVLIDTVRCRMIANSKTYPFPNKTQVLYNYHAGI